MLVVSPLDTLAFAVEATIHAVALAIQATIDPVTLAVEAPIDAVALAIQAPIHPITFSLQALGGAFVSGRVGAIGERVEPVFGAITGAVEPAIHTVSSRVEPTIDPIPGAVEAVLDAVAGSVELLLDAIPGVLGADRHRGEHADAQSARQQTIHFHHLVRPLVGVVAHPVERTETAAVDSNTDRPRWIVDNTGHARRAEAGKMSEPKARLPFGDAASTWFAHTFDAPTEVQTKGWKVIASGDHALLVAPTGSGKTLAAFLYGIDALSAPGGDRAPGVRLLYVSPLKALVHDIERNLRAPLVGIQRAAERLERPGRPVRVAIRTGDTAQRERAAQARNPAEILVTTPESLFLILGSKARQTLTTVETVIVDEVHALAPSKRGAHLALSLERLAELTGEDPQRIGLSATVRPVDEVALYLGGDRPVSVVDCNRIPNIRLQVCVPVPDMEQPTPPAPPQVRSGPILAELYAREVGTPQSERGIWPAIYPQLLEHVLANRSTIVFVNSRGLAERLAQRLNEMADEELVLAHHGSIAFEQRTVIEERLKSGQLRGIVATSSLELGIDMGSVDLVLLVESPGSVSRGLQRVGRSGHHVGVTSAGFIYPKFRADLLESAVVAERMLRGEIEALDIPRNPLDVLCQQLVAMCCDRPRRADDLERVARRAYPYRDLAPDALHAALDMLSGRYPSSEFADLRPRLAWDRGKDQLSARRGTALVSRMNAGTIPDRGHFPVHLGDGGPRVGELDEEMVFETRTGDLFLLGASTWRVESISRDRVVVSPAPGEPGSHAVLARRRSGAPDRARAGGGGFHPRARGARPRAGHRCAVRENAARCIRGAQSARLCARAGRAHRGRADGSDRGDRAISRRARRLASVHLVPVRRPGARALGDGARAPVVVR